ncbi:hypothetical protein BDZ97DRAFT_1916819 [Flammula alnicola]|nr:hypothetical protein BDZ97DRAFT_1916819 [Flammula alnicola]
MADAPPPSYDWRRPEVDAEQEVPSYQAPTTFAIGSTRTTQPLVKVVEVKGHLVLLHAFAKLKTDVTDLQAVVEHMPFDDERRWSWFVGVAVERFDIWCHNLKARDARNEMDVIMPPIDVIMVWHAYMLNPRWYAEDCSRVPACAVLKELGVHFDKALFHMILSAPPSQARLDFWQRRTSLPFDPIEGMKLRNLNKKIIPCPQCRKPVEIVLMHEGGTGYLQQKFSAHCYHSSCGIKEITKETLGVRKLAQDLVASSGLGIPSGHLPGTLFNPSSPADAETSDKIKARVCATAIASQPAHKLLPSTGAGYSEQLCLAIMKMAGYSLSKLRPIMATNSNKASQDRLLRRILDAYNDDKVYSVELVGAVLRQGLSLRSNTDLKMYELGWTQPGFFDGPGDELALQHALSRYHAFLDLLASSPASFFVPTLDIDLIWHTHQLLVNRYEADCNTYVGRFIDHDDKVEGLKLSSAFDITCQAWKERFNVQYTHCGCPVPGTSIGQRLSRLIKIYAPPPPSHLTPFSDRPDLLSATHPSDHNAVRFIAENARAHRLNTLRYAQLSLDKTRAAEKAAKKTAKQEAKGYPGTAHSRLHAARCSRSGNRPAFQPSRDHTYDTPFLVPVPLYYSTGPPLGCVAVGGSAVNPVAGCSSCGGGSGGASGLSTCGSINGSNCGGGSSGGGVSSCGGSSGGAVQGPHVTTSSPVEGLTTYNWRKWHSINNFDTRAHTLLMADAPPPSYYKSLSGRPGEVDRELPSYHAPTTFAIGSTRTTEPLVKVAEVKDHLALLHSFAQLKNDVTASKIVAEHMPSDNERRWSWFVGIAVERFDIWCHNLKAKDARNEPMEIILPPIDVIMVWHAYMLNPRWYAEDCLRVPACAVLKELGVHFTKALLHFHAILSVPPSEARLDFWRQRTALPFDPIEGLKTRNLNKKIIPCPQCRSRVEVELMHEGGTGYLQQKFSAHCYQLPCTIRVSIKEITKGTLGLRKLAQDLVAPAGTPTGHLPGTLFSPSSQADAEASNKIKARVCKAAIASQPASKWLPSTDPGCSEQLCLAIMKLAEYSLPKLRALMANDSNKPTQDRLLRRILDAYSDDKVYSVELVGAVLRQGSFVEKMHELGWTHPGFFDGPGDELALQHALSRYHAFLDLLASSPGSFFVPTLDIDLVWHTHQLLATRYEADCNTYVGRFIDHDDKVEGLKLSSGFDITGQAWQERFNVQYTHCGCPVPGTTIGQRLTRLIKIYAPPPPSHLMPFSDRPDLLCATHPSDHNAVRFIPESARVQKINTLRYGQLAMKRRQAVAEAAQKTAKQQAGGYPGTAHSRLHAASVSRAGNGSARDHTYDTPFLVPVPLYFAKGATSVDSGCVALGGGSVTPVAGCGSCGGGSEGGASGLSSCGSASSGSGLSSGAEGSGGGRVSTSARRNGGRTASRAGSNGGRTSGRGARSNGGRTARASVGGEAISFCGGGGASSCGGGGMSSCGGSSGEGASTCGGGGASSCGGSSSCGGGGGSSCGGS